MFDAYKLNRSAQYATLDEIDYLGFAARELALEQIVMLGAGPGVLALAAMDEYVRWGYKQPFITIVDINNADYAVRHLTAMGVNPSRISTVIEDSAKAVDYWLDGEIDLLIVDADHSTEAVLRDIDAWFPHVGSGGLIFFHDYLEREGGFNGTGKWEKGAVAKALEQRHHLSWLVEAEVGISIVYRKL